jgi:hypothetical protein
MKTLEKKDKVRDEIKTSVFSNMLMLSHCCLKLFPSQLLANESILKLRRLDLSHNSIVEIPLSICLLVGLKELWLQHNPIAVFPPGVQALPKLELIDISSTNISELPTELAKLEQLYEFDWRHTPLAEHLLTKHHVETNDTLKLRKLLLNLNTRKELEHQLFEYLKDEHFIMDADVLGVKAEILALVKVSLDTYIYRETPRCAMILTSIFFPPLHRTCLRSSRTWRRCGSTCGAQASCCLSASTR